MSRRERLAQVSAAASITAFATALFDYAVLEASFRTWSVGKYVAGKGQVLVDGFISMFLLACLTLLLSSLGQGRSRVFGVISSVLTLCFITFVFLTSK